MVGQTTISAQSGSRNASYRKLRPAVKPTPRFSSLSMVTALMARLRCGNSLSKTISIYSVYRHTPHTGFNHSTLGSSGRCSMHGPSVAMNIMWLRAARRWSVGSSSGSTWLSGIGYSHNHLSSKRGTAPESLPKPGVRASSLWLPLQQAMQPRQSLMFLHRIQPLVT